MLYLLFLFFLPFLFLFLDFDFSSFLYTPLQIKQALVGYGHAEKTQVQTMVKTILHLKEIPRPDDTADALDAAVCHGHAAAARKVLAML